MTTPTKPCRSECACPCLGKVEWCECCAAPAPEAKPTRVEVGQRWSEGPGEEYEVVSGRPGAWRLRWGTAEDGYSPGFDYKDASVLCDTFLGYAKPAAPAETPRTDVTSAAIPSARSGVVLTPPAPPRPVRREVSCDGRNWCDHAMLVDGDAFGSYPWRRETVVGQGWSLAGEAPSSFTRAGVEWFEWSPAPKPDPGRAFTASDEAGDAAQALVAPTCKQP